MIKYYCDNPECGVEVNIEATTIQIQAPVSTPRKPILWVTKGHSDTYIDFCKECYLKFDKLTKQDIIKKLLS